MALFGVETIRRFQNHDLLHPLAHRILDQLPICFGRVLIMNDLQWINICLAFLSANIVKGMRGRTQLAKKTRALVEHDRALNNWPRPNT